MNRTILSAAVLGIAAGAHAQVTLDGVADKSYGPAIVVQDTQTQFGDASDGLVDRANGSELDGAYARIENDTLYLLLAGNLESNFNKLEVFIDAVEGGQNQLRGDNPDVDFNGVNRMGDDLSTKKVVEGLTFDADFAADLWVGLTCGGEPFAGYMNYAELLTDGMGFGSYLGSGGAGEAGAVLFKSGFGFGLDNSNTAGVVGGAEIGDGSGVFTGVELAIPLSAIPGYMGGDLKVCAFINGGGHDFVSNQVLGGLGGGANLGEPRFVNFDFVPGSQYFVVAAGGGGGSCTGDFDMSGTVDASDLAVLLGAWGGSGGDLNGDMTTDASDLAVLLGAWGNCP
ncbi:MAG: hypothetical protein RI967_10 [Planctomycetota bacterium]|jgi:hypothetical protein